MSASVEEMAEVVKTSMSFQPHNGSLLSGQEAKLSGPLQQPGYMLQSDRGS